MSEFSACVLVKDIRDKWICRTGFPTLEAADNACSILWKEMHDKKKANNPEREPQVYSQIIIHATPLGKYFLPALLKYRYSPSVITHPAYEEKI